MLKILSVIFVFAAMGLMGYGAYGMLVSGHLNPSDSTLLGFAFAIVSGVLYRHP